MPKTSVPTAGSDMDMEPIHSPEESFGKKVLRAYDKQTGEMIAELALPSFTIGPPMTYMAGGRQFIVCGMGIRRDPHRLVALALPQEG